MRLSYALAAALAAAILAVAPATAKRSDRTITIRLTSKVDQAKLVDNAPTGDSPGDVLIFTEKLFNARGKQVGTDAASCTRLFDASSLCTGVYKLRGGQIHVQLVQPGPSGTYDQAITGGTGRYAGARGTVTVAQGGSGGDHFTFKIRR
jgi:hypothetical protein